MKVAKSRAGRACPKCPGSALKTQTPGLEPCDEVAGAVGGRESPGDGTGRGGGPAETQTTGLGQEALNQCPAPAPPGPELHPLD